MNTASLETTLKQLRLSGLCQTLDVRLQEAAANRLGHAEFLELICKTNSTSGSNARWNAAPKPPTSTP